MDVLFQPRRAILQKAFVQGQKVKNALASADPALGSDSSVWLKDSRGRPIIPRLHFAGPRDGGDAIRIGLFAGIHGDEAAGVHSLLRFHRLLLQDPDIARGYELYFYPICNPHGFEMSTRHSREGKDLNREFWTNSAAPEVQVLEREIVERKFHGLISLHADDTSEGLYGFVRGAVLSKALLEPALKAAEQVLPRNADPVIDGFPAENGIIANCYDGILASPPDLHPCPFEIILETPHLAPAAKQEGAILLALRSILGEYGKFLSYAADL